MDNTIVSLSEQAFFTVVTAALEAYKVDHAKSSENPETHLETFGNLWGYETATQDGVMIYHINSADVSTAAERTESSVRPKDDAYTLKQNFMNYFFPELKFLGDYHSHPYSLTRSDVKTELDLERHQLYHFSPADFRAVEQEHKEGKNYRVGLVITVYEREQRVHRQDQWIDDTSCVRFQYDNVTIWIKAYVWNGEDFRKRADKKVSLICPAVGFTLRSLREASV
jgi:hypothetical protein